MKLFYSAGSPPARSVLMTIRCLDLEVEIVPIDLLKGDNKHPDFLKLNPLGKIPVLIDGDFVLTESRAIMTYLVYVKKHGDSLYPENARKRAIIDSRLYFDATTIFPLLHAAAHPLFFDGKKEVTDEIRIKFKENLKHIDDFLNDKLFLAGNEPTLADISILSSVVLIMSLFGDVGDLPNLKAWFKRCEHIPGYEENLKGGKIIDETLAEMGIKLAPLYCECEETKKCFLCCSGLHEK